MMNELVQSKAEALARICRNFHVRRLELFGSACTEEFDPQRSDLDFLVEFSPDQDLGPWLSRLFEIEAALSDLFDRRVHLVMTSALLNPWFHREAEKTRTVVYDAS
jgi:predicted nucleotidyltransferase